MITNDDPDAPLDLIVTYGDCEFIGQCACGQLLGSIRPDQSLDALGQLWERHAMTACSKVPEARTA